MSLLGLDIGTSGCKATAFSTQGAILAHAYREYDLVRPKPEWAEFNSYDVLEKVKDVMRYAAAGTRSDPVTAFCVSSCGEAMTPVSRDRKIIGNAIMGYEKRGSQYVQKLIEAVGEEEIFSITGNRPSHIFSALKLVWIKENMPEMYNKAAYFLLWPDLVFFILGCNPATDYSMANRTLLFDQESANWSEKIIQALGLDIEKLPDVVPSGTDIGTVSDRMAKELGLRRGVRCITGGLDQCCSVLGVGAVKSNRTCYSMGTFICITPAFFEKPDLEKSFAINLSINYHVIPKQFVTFIHNATGGSVLKWFRDELTESRTAKQKSFDTYTSIINQAPENPTDLLVLPFFTPTGAPFLDMKTPGALYGIRLGTTRWQIMKALMEGVTYFFAEGMQILEEIGIDIVEYWVTGGGAKSDKWIQLTSDIMGKPFVKPKILEAATLGAAIIAGTTARIYKSLHEAVEQHVQIEKVFEPNIKKHAIYEEKLEQYKKMRIAMLTLSEDIGI
jgi:xylulokinase